MAALQEFSPPPFRRCGSVDQGLRGAALEEALAALPEAAAEWLGLLKAALASDPQPQHGHCTPPRGGAPSGRAELEARAAGCGGAALSELLPLLSPTGVLAGMDSRPLRLTAFRLAFAAGAAAAADDDPATAQPAACVIVAGAADPYSDIRSCTAKRVPGLQRAALALAAGELRPLLGSGAELPHWTSASGACEALGAIVRTLGLPLCPPRLLAPAVSGAAGVSAPRPAARHADPGAVLGEAAEDEDAEGPQALPPPTVRALLELIAHETLPVREGAARALGELSRATPPARRAPHCAPLWDWAVAAARTGLRESTALAAGALHLLRELRPHLPAGPQRVAVEVAELAARHPSSAVRQSAVDLLVDAAPALDDAGGQKHFLQHLAKMVESHVDCWQAADGALMVLDDHLCRQVCSQRDAAGASRGALQAARGELAELLRLIGGPRIVTQQQDQEGGFDIARMADQALAPLAEAVVAAEADATGATSEDARYWIAWKVAAAWLCGVSGEPAARDRPRCPLDRLPQGALEPLWAAGHGDGEGVQAVQTRLLLLAYFDVPPGRTAELAEGALREAERLEREALTPGPRLAGSAKRNYLDRLVLGVAKVLPDVVPRAAADPAAAGGVLQIAARCAAQLLTRTNDSTAQQLLLSALRRVLAAAGAPSHRGPYELPCFAHAGFRPPCNNPKQELAMCLARLDAAQGLHRLPLVALPPPPPAPPSWAEAAAGTCAAAGRQVLEKHGTEVRICRAALHVIEDAGAVSSPPVAWEMLVQLAASVEKRALSEGLRMVDGAFVGSATMTSSFDSDTDDEDGTSSAGGGGGDLMSRLAPELRVAAAALQQRAAAAGEDRHVPSGAVLSWLLSPGSPPRQPL